MTTSEVPTEPPDVDAAPATRRELAVARALDSARSRAENRVELFLDAARELMNTNATDFTVQEVVERSGQSLRTFYQYFAGKYELLLALFEESVEGAAAQLEIVVAERDDPIERLHAFCVEYNRMCRTSAPGTEPTNPRPDPHPRWSSSPSSCSRRIPKRRRTRSPPSSSSSVVSSTTPTRRARSRPGLDRQRITGVVLQATMFNAFAATISASPPGSGGEVLWDLLVHGIAADR